ncbi:MAG: histidine triad nucleotide-binding protein [Gammaproteobacteria bacterium]|nr:histidine triad nucleotide-binding protein [Gammaproteobacteria bacterium]NND38579.1 histidine triad nucleotide-binding protein [Pseudomonadales bacterium]MBT8151111.1 histidine triad nucleotide-binding protein [Gammaproteobacteria bacterium]NNL11621.1 histidine triad nucleotide-binding protein [Pseudomonadales bacterium]NNM10469.1 histidine triad nucleotide-binding protein [Pseudomonadales bacterium]
MSDTIFGKIISGEIPADKIYEDEHCIAINDVNPQAPVHVLVIPKRAIPKLSEATGDDQALLGHLLLVVKKLAAQLGVAEGFRVIINNGKGGGQTVFHLHLHIIGGFKMGEGMV